MTNKQAIEKLNDIRCHVKETSIEEQALVMAIEALKKAGIYGDIIYRKDALMCLTGEYPADFKHGELIAKFIRRIRKLPPAQPEPSEITDEQAILHLQSTGWMQNHDREMYESGLREQLADDSGGYDSLIPCEDTISRQVAINVLSHMCSEDEKGIIVSRANVDSMLKSLPSAQPEQKTGAWIPYDTIPRYVICRCSACGTDILVPCINDKTIFNYCPNCGADMRGEPNEIY